MGKNCIFLYKIVGYFTYRDLGFDVNTEISVCRDLLYSLTDLADQFPDIMRQVAQAFGLGNCAGISLGYTTSE